MHHLTKTRRRKVAAVTATLFLLAVASAFGFYTLLFSGSGSGSAKLGSAGGSAVLALHASFSEGLRPGESETVTYSATNATNQNAIVHRLFISPGVDAAHEAAGCQGNAWFSLGNPNSSLAPLEGGGEVSVPANSTVTLGTNTLTFLDKPESQDACGGATLSLALSSV